LRVMLQIECLVRLMSSGHCLVPRAKFLVFRVQKVHFWNPQEIDPKQEKSSVGPGFSTTF
jgi:hypothetical protein